MQGIEIEKKYRVTQLPEDLEKYQKIEIEQAYLNHGCKPTLRLRKYNEDEYILSYKAKRKGHRDDLSVCDEIELSLSKEAYEHLKNKHVPSRYLNGWGKIYLVRRGLKMDIWLLRLEILGNIRICC